MTLPFEEAVEDRAQRDAFTVATALAEHQARRRRRDIHAVESRRERPQHRQQVETASSATAIVSSGLRYQPRSFVRYRPRPPYDRAVRGTGAKPRSRAAATNSRNSSAARAASAASRRARSAAWAATARLRRVARSRSASTLRGYGRAVPGMMGGDSGGSVR